MSVPSTPQKWCYQQEPQIGVEHCGVKLKKTDEEIKRCREQFHFPLLIRASGNPSFVRLIVPKFGSIVEGCSYLLITDMRIIVYNGTHSTISSRAKISQMAYEIIAGKEMPTSANRVEIANDDRKTECHFWNALMPKNNGEEDGGKENFVKTEHNEEKENGGGAFEESWEEDALFEVQKDGILQKLWKGRRPECAELFDPIRVLIYYFVSEVYVWSGVGANRSLLEKALNFARTMKDAPISERAKRIICQHSSTADHRKWTIVRRQTGGSLVDSLFRHKFEKWNEQRQKGLTKIRACRPMSMPVPNNNAKSIQMSTSRSALIRELASKMGQNCCATGMELVLEGTALSPEDGNVFTEQIDIFVAEGELLIRMDDQKEDGEWGRLTEFQMNKCYVIGWEYRVERKGIRKLDGTEAAPRECGRRRKCYFYWLGSDTTVADQSRCALALRDWDTERREHIRVESGSEPPMLLHILGGLLVKGTGSGIFCAIASSGHLCVLQELRPKAHFCSQGAYLRINDRQIECLNGSDCPEGVAKCALQMAQKLAKCKKLELKNEQMRRMSESDKVIEPIQWTKSPRMFRYNEEELCELGCPHPNANFTFHQNHLRDCIFVDQISHLWIWCASDQQIPSMALQIAFYHWYGEKYSPGALFSEDDLLRHGTARVIYEHAEPNEFKALFAEWKEPSADQGKKPSHNLLQCKTLFAVISDRLKLRSLDQLRRREIPLGCDTKHLEDYLSEEDFERVFEMSRTQFGALPRWRQLAMKKKAELF